jgi:16S rRNA (cytosine967-C5)-methyltransferase
MKISPARTAAFDILLRIERDGAFSSILLPQYESELDPKDRALCHEIVLGVLRQQMYLDRVLETFVGDRKLDLEVRITLRIGLFQILYLDKIPAFSAVNESVNLVGRAKKSSAKGLVNATLRNAARSTPDIVYNDDIERISVETSHPRWLIDKWIGEFGPDDAEKIAESNNRPPTLVFRATMKTGNMDLSLLGRPLDIPGRSYVADAFMPTLREATANDQVYFQDAGSQMVAEAVSLEPGQRFLDVCASPGSKTTYVAAFFRPTFIIAGDVSAARVRLLRENCVRQGADFVYVSRYDAAQSLPFAEESFDVVLVDAPCTGTGTIRHNPEIRYFLKPADFAELSLKQLAILTNASKVVRKSGRLIYSTCSLEFEENERVAERFAAENPEFSTVRPNVDQRFITKDGFARTFPHREGFDGFFIAEFRRSV